jgi:hypothetical protein
LATTALEIDGDVSVCDYGERHVDLTQWGNGKEDACLYKDRRVLLRDDQSVGHTHTHTHLVALVNKSVEFTSVILALYCVSLTAQSRQIEIDVFIMWPTNSDFVLNLLSQ